MDEFLEELNSKKMVLESKRPLSKNRVFKLEAELKLIWTYSTNAIEGNTLSMEETKAVVQGLVLTGVSFRDVAEVKNHYAAIAYVESMITQNTSLTAEQICHINFCGISCTPSFSVVR